MECWANSINRITPALQLPRTPRTSNLPVLLLQRINWFVKFSCRLAFISRTAISDPRKRAMERIEIETYSLYNARKEFRL